jgi:hypothetical protein
MRSKQLVQDTKTTLLVALLIIYPSLANRMQESLYIYILERDAGGERVQIRTAKPILPNFNGNAAGSGGKTSRLLFALQSRNGILD